MLKCLISQNHSYFNKETNDNYGPLLCDLSPYFQRRDMTILTIQMQTHTIFAYIRYMLQYEDQLMENIFCEMQ